MFGDERGEKSFSLMHLYVKTVCMTQYKTFKQFVGLFLYLPNVWNHCTRVIWRKKNLILWDFYVLENTNSKNLPTVYRMPVSGTREHATECPFIQRDGLGTCVGQGARGKRYTTDHPLEVSMFSEWGLNPKQAGEAWCFVLLWENFRCGVNCLHQHMGAGTRERWIEGCGMVK